MDHWTSTIHYLQGLFIHKKLTLAHHPYVNHATVLTFLITNWFKARLYFFLRPIYNWSSLEKYGFALLCNMIGLKNFIQSEVKLLKTNPQGISVSDPQSCLLWWGLWPVILSPWKCFETILVCPCLLTNRTSLELQSLLSDCLFFFLNSIFQIGGVAYLQVRLTHGLLPWYYIIYIRVIVTSILHVFIDPYPVGFPCE